VKRSGRRRKRRLKGERPGRTKQKKDAKVVKTKEKW
jgi:hypothetical protein